MAAKSHGRTPSKPFNIFVMASISNKNWRFPSFVFGNTNVGCPFRTPLLSGLLLLLLLLLLDCCWNTGWILAAAMNNAGTLVSTNAKIRENVSIKWSGGNNENSTWCILRMLVATPSKNTQHNISQPPPVSLLLLLLFNAALARSSKSVFGIVRARLCSTIPPIIETNLFNTFSLWSLYSLRIWSRSFSSICCFFGSWDINPARTWGMIAITTPKHCVTSDKCLALMDFNFACEWIAPAPNTNCVVRELNNRNNSDTLLTLFVATLWKWVAVAIFAKTISNNNKHDQTTL